MCRRKNTKISWLIGYTFFLTTNLTELSEVLKLKQEKEKDNLDIKILQSQQGGSALMRLITAKKKKVYI